MRKALLALLALCGVAQAQVFEQPTPPSTTIVTNPYVFDIRTFGAKCNFATNPGSPNDDTAAINAAIAAAATAQSSATSPRSVKIVWCQQGISYATGTINFTALSGNTNPPVPTATIVDMSGSCHVANTNGQPAFDAMNTNWLVWQNICIRGSATNPPNVGLQIGRASSGLGAGGMVFNRPSIEGNYTFAAVYIMASEENLWLGARISNANTSGVSYALVEDGLNWWVNNGTVTSPNVALTSGLPANGYSFIHNTFIGGTLSNSNLNAPSSCAWIAASKQHHFVGTYCASGLNGNNVVPGFTLFQGAVSNNNNLQFDIHQETVGTNSTFFLTGVPGSATFTGSIAGTTLTASAITGTIAVGQKVTGTGVTTNTVIQSGSGGTWTVNNSQNVSSESMSSAGNTQNNLSDFVYTEVNAFGQTNIFAIDGSSNISSATLSNPNINIDTFQNVTATLFDTPAKYTLNGGNVFLQAAGNWIAPSSYTGTMVCTPTCNNTFTFGGQIVPSTTSGIKGTAAADSANAGAVGELWTLHCPVPNTATVTITIATPGVVNWPSYPGTITGPANWTCPINFTTSGSLPTGIVAGTNYWIIGSTLNSGGSGNFQIADTPAHAIANTNAVATSGSQSGTQTGVLGGILSSTVAQVGAGFSLSAGDWDCTGLAEYNATVAPTSTGYYSALSQTTGLPPLGQYTQFRFPSGSLGATSWDIASPVVQENINAATNFYVVTDQAFSSGGPPNGGGLLRCRRMR